MAKDLNTTGRWLKRLTQGLANEPQDRQELLGVLREAAERGLVDADALTMLEGVLEVGDLKVRDIMRTAARNAVAQQSMTVKEALLMMTKAKSGSVSVTNGRGKLIGVFTDGDLRRQMAVQGDVLSRTLAAVMTPKPISIQEDALAAEALKIFNERNIDDLIVTNAKNEPVGMVDSQDLPKLKLM